MAQVDSIIGFMLKQKGIRLEVPSDHSCVMTTPTGERPLNRVLTQAEVEKLVEEILPEDCRDKYEAGGRFSFPYQADGATVAIRIAKVDDDLAVTIGVDEDALEPEPEPEVPPAEIPRPGPPPEQEPPPAAEAPVAPPPPTAVQQVVPVTAPAVEVAVPTVAAVPLPEPAEPDPKLVHIAETAGAYGALDVVLLPGCRPLGRHLGSIRPLEQFDELPQNEVESLLLPLVPGWDRRTPTAVTRMLGDKYRGRFTMSLTRGHVSASIRLLRNPPPKLEDLDAPKGLAELCNQSEGLILVCARAGHGRSTTVAALVEEINRAHRKYVIAMSPVIEYLHSPVNSYISEREIGSCSEDWSTWLDEIPAERPHVITLDNVASQLPLLAAIHLSLEGILVIGEAPAMSSTAAIEDAIRSMTVEYPAAAETFADVFRGLIFQVLCPAENDSVRAAYEVILGTPPIVSAIRNSTADSIISHARAGRSGGMVLLNDSLLELVKQGHVRPEDAIQAATDRDEMAAMIEESGIDLPAAE